MQNQTLHQTLMDFPLAQTGGRYTFLDRLCRENNWPRGRGLRAISEYKRFLYLAAVSPTPVTPPPAVDRCWHLHLLYTRSYWDGLCQGILGRPLHHGPTAGGDKEDAKFENWYERTRELYSAEFGEVAPEEIWPLRFSAEKPQRWIDAAKHWIIPKPSFSAALPGVFPLLLGGGAIPMLLILLVFGFIVLMVRLANSGSDEKKQRGDSGGGCATFDGGGGSGDCGDSGGGDCGGGDGGGGCGGGGCGGGD